MASIPRPPEGHEPSIRLDDDSIPLHVRRDEAERMMLKALEVAKSRGVTWARAEAAYYSAKARETFELYDQGMPVTAINDVIKGMPETNKALETRNAEKVGYENASDAVQCFKLIVRTLEADIAREWSSQDRLYQERYS